MKPSISIIRGDLRIMIFLAAIAIAVLHISGCDELFGGPDESPGSTYSEPQYSLAWSPDSSMLAFISVMNLIVRDTDTGELRALTGSGFYDEPTWSPDSVEIAYSTSSYAIREDIWAKKADGSNVARRITSHKAADYHPRWSPDGTKIAFESYRTKSMDIWIRNADGSGEDILTASSDSADMNAEWSPDSTRLAFESTRSGNSDIWIARIDGSDSPVQMTSDEAEDTEPMWSPDGTRIAFISNRSGSLGVWVENSDGTGEPVYITPEFSDAGLQDWSSDGKWIAFVSGGIIYVGSSDGSGEATEIAKGSETRWSPDGTKIAFSELKDKQYNIQVIELPEQFR